MVQNPIFVFLSTFLSLILIFFLFPINLFDGKIVYEYSSKEHIIDAPLSLSYFIGLGYDESDMVSVKEFYLTIKGSIMASILIFGFPTLLALRVYLKSKKN